MNIEKDKVCILIPTLNEAPTIRDLISEFKEMGYTNIVVMDGNSRDATREIASESGARVMVQSAKGKGNALIEAFHAIDSPYILMLDGDGTYSPQDAEIMLNPLMDGYDQVIGNRLIPGNQPAFSRLNLFGNQFINRLFKLAQGKFLFDILSGYRTFTSESIKQLHLKESGFEIETEISAEAVRNDQKIKIVPIQYLKRPGTNTKLNPFHDGLKITTTIYKLAKSNNPMFYFGLIGVIIMIAGFITGTYVLFEWFQGIDHLPLTVLTVLLVVVGFQVFMFGVISDMLLGYHREVMYELQQINSPKRR
ncbi:MAG: S-layer glycoprotein N-glycosyltransferase AglJ [Methanomicrobiales archaeon]